MARRKHNKMSPVAATRSHTQNNTSIPWHLLCVLFLVATVIYFYWGHLVGTAFLWFDGLFQVLPRKRYIALALAQGRLPLWCPYVMGGAPFMADPINSPFYLFQITLPLLTLITGEFRHIWFNHTIIIKSLFCAVATYYLLRRVLRFHPLSAVFTVIAFLFSTAATVRTIQFAHYTVIVFIPPILLLCMHLPRAGWRWILMTMLTLAACLLSDNHQYVYLLFFAMGILFITDAVYMRKTPARIVRLFCAYTIISIGAVALAVILLIPMAEFAFLDERIFEEPSGAPLSYFITYLLPHYYGKVTSQALRYFGHEGFWNYWEISMYVGIPTLILAALSPVLARRRATYFALALILFSFIYSFGTRNPFPLYFPLGTMMRIPSKMLIFAAWGLALMAGATVHTLLTTPLDNRQRRVSTVILIAGTSLVLLVLLIAPHIPRDPAHAIAARAGMQFALAIAIISCACVIICLFTQTYARIALSALTILLFVDLSHNNKDFPAGHQSYAEFFAPHPLITHWRAEREHELFRVDGGPFTAMNLRPLYYEFECLTGFSSFETTSFRTMKRLRSLNRTRFYHLYNIRYVVQNDGSILSLDDTLPRTFLVSNMRAVPEDDIPQLLADINFSPRDTVLVSEAYADDAHTFPPLDNDAYARITSYAAEKIVIDVYTPTDAYLVLLDAPYPGWRVKVNGVSDTWIPAFIHARAVHIPPGTHTVTWRYMPTSFIIGASISGVSALLFIVAIIIAPRLPPLMIS